MTNFKRDGNRVPVVGGVLSTDGVTPTPIEVTADGKLKVDATVNASISGTAVPISGATTAVGVAIVDSSGNQISSFGGGTQYTEGDTDATITGTAALVEGAANALAVMTQPLTDTQLRASDVKITLDGESVPVTNAGITTIAGAVSGTEMQVDVLTMPTTTVQATNLDIRDLSSASDTITIHGDVGVVDQLDLTNSNPAAVAIVDGNGDQITSFGGGTQYTEGDTDATITGTAALVEGAANALAVMTQPLTDTQLRATAVPVSGTFWQATQPISGTVTATATDLDIRNLVNTDVVTAELSAVDNAVLDVIAAKDFATQTTLASALTSLQLLDDVVATLGTTTYTEAATKGSIIGAVRRDADTTLVDTTNEIGPLQMNAAGQLKVEVFSGEALPVTLTSTTVTGTVSVTQSGTWDEVGINDSGNSITVDNGGTFVVQENGAALTALQLLDDTVYVDDADWTDSTSKHLLVGGLYQSTPQTVTDGDVAPFNITASGALHVAVQGTATVSGTVTANLSATDNAVLDAIEADTTTIAGAVSGTEMQVDVLTMPTVTVTATNLDVQSGGADLATSTQAAAIQTAVEIIDNAIAGSEMQVDVVGALPAGTNAIGKLAANSGVDIGDVDVTSISAGSNLIGDVSLQPRTGNGCTIFRSIDLDETEEDIKTSAGNLYGYFAFNSAATTHYIKFYNATAANVTVGTTTPVLTFPLPAGSAANISFAYPISFDTAITAAATTGIADNDTGAPSANTVVLNAFYK